MIQIPLLFDDSPPVQVLHLPTHCTNCKWEKAVDRAECNACARQWQRDWTTPYWERKE